MPLLDWVNKPQAAEAASNVPYRLFQFRSAHGDESADNLLIQGDNLAALKALLPFYRGQIKCTYIDPPYNTQSAFEHYDDKLEHSQWLSMMYPRLALLRELLSDGGSLWTQLDDNEAHYFRVIADEVFGRRNFIADVTWQKSYAVRSNAEFFSTSTEHILVYAKDRSQFRPNKFGRSDEQKSRFANPDNDPRGPWQSITFTISLVAGARGRQFARTGTSPNIYEVTSPSGARFMPPPGRCWARAPDAYEKLRSENRLFWGLNGDRAPRLKMFLSETEDAVIPTTLWASGEEFGFNQDGIRELRALGLNFPTPKPERLIERILHIASNPGDLVLDSFLGSGTTAAVAHKMGRRWIGVEAGTHASTHCVPRLEQVIAGEQGGVSKALGWKGGGGFRFHTLGEGVFDAEGGINPEVRFGALASFIWHFETGQAAPKKLTKPLLGVHEGTAYYLLYNGVLGDRRPQSGNVLTNAVLEHLDDAYPHKGPRVIYGEMTRLGETRLRDLEITFKQIPYDVRAR